MNGAESLVRTLLAHGIDTCFANPGTSEMHFVSALDRHPEMRCVLALFEGVATGAADGYARIAGKPAAALMHCGPGLANGLAGLHNAQSARTPVLAIVGDLATYHRDMAPPLATDIEAMARSATPWVRTVRDAAEISRVASEAIMAARAPSGSVSTLIIPSDVCWNAGAALAPVLPYRDVSAIDELCIEETRRVLCHEGPSVIILAGAALGEEGLELAWRIAGKTGAHLYAEQFNACIARGRGRLPIDRLSYRLEQGIASLSAYKQVVLWGAAEPIAFFAYPGQPTTMVAPGAEVHVGARPEEDLVQGLRDLADRLGASAEDVPPMIRHPAGVPGPLNGIPTPEGVAAVLGRVMPDQAIVVDESISFGRQAWFPGTCNASPHVWMVNAGGSIGHGMPMATGAAVAASGRRVISLQADGSAMYTLQSLWTQARENLDVTTVILSNRRYAVLLAELRNVGVGTAGENARRLIELDQPPLDWVNLARGHGVAAEKAEDLETLERLLRHGLSRSGPSLIELMI